MFRNALAAALRHFARNRFYTAIAVLGLAVGLCGALLAALFIRSQYSYDHFVPGYRNLYLTTLTINLSGRSSLRVSETPAQIAAIMRESFPQVVSVTRLAREQVRLRAGEVEHAASIYSVDPDFFDTLPLAVAAGDAAAALAQPDRLVMTREDARTFFGDEAPLGRTLDVRLQDGSRHAVTVGALIEAIPRNRTQLQARIFISGNTAWARLAVLDRRTGPVHGLFSEVRTLVRLRDGVSPLSLRDGLQQVLPRLIQQLKPSGEADSPDDKASPELDLLRIDRVNTDPRTNSGFTTRVVMAAALGLIVLLIAAVNFVNLLTARSGTRALEVGVRKLAGAGRTMLALQFLGESCAYVAIAVLLALAMTELLLPYVNAFLDADAGFAYWREPALLGGVLLGAAVLGLAAGSWPALVLAGLHPIGALRGARLAQSRGGLVRRLLVTLQFALLSGLIVAAGVVYLQRHYATQQALRFDTDQMLILETRCTPALLGELRKLAGVRDAACADQALISDGWSTSDAKTREGRHVTMNMAWIDDRVLALYGIAPLAGRTLSAADFDAAAGRSSTRYLINETAMRLLDFDSPAAALGPYPLMNGLAEIVGVLPDFSMGPVDQKIMPTVFYADPANFSRVFVKLKGADVPPTLAAIDRLWNATGGIGELNRYFFEERVERMYRAMLREAHAVGVIALVAVGLACLGLLGLAAAIAEQRTKEIGVRKALGATTGDVLELLLWQFVKPVAWANLIAWPVAALLLERWLNGFAYHIDLPLWLFPTAALVALLIALATVATHSILVARAKPVAALRYE